MLQVVRGPSVSLDVLYDELAYAGRYGGQQFPWATSTRARLRGLNAATARIVAAENATSTTQPDSEG